MQVVAEVAAGMCISAQYRTAAIIVLLLFVIYAISPVCITFLPGEGGVAASSRHNDATVKVGIVWLKVFLTALTDSDPDDINGDGLLDGDQVLAAKEHALLRAHLRFKPFFEAQPRLLRVPEPLLDLAREYEVPKDLHHLESDGYTSLNTGLSPPVLFS